MRCGQLIYLGMLIVNEFTTPENAHIIDIKGIVQADLAEQGTLQSGEPIAAFTVLAFTKGSEISLSYDDGSQQRIAFPLGDDEDSLRVESISGSEQSQVNSTETSDNVLSDIEAIQALIESGDDIETPDTVAGGETGNEGTDFVAVARDGEELLAQAGFDTQSLEILAETPTLAQNDETTPDNNPPVDAPTVVVDDTVSVDEDTIVNIDVIANDTDVDGPVSAVATVTQGTNGTVSINSDGTVKYTPNANFNGPDSFTYTNADGGVGTINLDVTPVDDATVVVDDAVSVSEDTIVNIDVIANDTDIDGPVSAVATVTQGTNGTVSINSDGTVKYTPNANFNGPDSFTYTNADGGVGTVNLDVTPVDDATVVVDDAVTVDEDTIVNIDVIANDTDVDGPVS
ncbi:MAG: VCBS repeat-containing protein, partial [Paraglaciecola sp.]